MGNQDSNKNPMEGAATLTGIRSDNLQQQMNPEKLPDENPRFPENQDDAEAKNTETEEVTSGTTTSVLSHSDISEKDFKVGGPLTVDFDGKQIDEYSKDITSQ